MGGWFGGGGGSSTPAVTPPVSNTANTTANDTNKKIKKLTDLALGRSRNQTAFGGTDLSSVASTARKTLLGQ